MASTAFAAAKFLPATHLDSSPRLSPLWPAPTANLCFSPLSAASSSSLLRLRSPSPSGPGGKLPPPPRSYGGGGGSGDAADSGGDGRRGGILGLFLAGWAARVTAHPQFPFKVLMEELVGVSAACSATWPPAPTSASMADVDDDVLGADPTAHRFETEMARIMGKEAALFVPSGTMANLISVLVHCDTRGSVVILGDNSHIHMYENGGISTIGGVHPKTVRNNPDGTMDIDKIVSAIRHSDGALYYPTTRLICLENTHANCGGKCLSVEYTDKVGEVAKSHGLKLHIDGARIFNASVTLGVPVHRLVKAADSVSVCLSKGLGTPVGSVIVGSKGFIDKAKILRKTLGGGMRQVGILCAATYVAVRDTVGKLADDHRKAKVLADGLKKIKQFTVDSTSVETNMILNCVLIPKRKIKYCGLVLLVDSLQWPGVTVTTREALSRSEGSCTSEVIQTLPYLKKAYGNEMQKVLHVGPDSCTVVSNLLKEGKVEAWGVEPCDLEDADSSCKSLVRKGFVRMADIKFPLPYRPDSFNLVVVSDALDYLTPRYLNKTLPDLARISTNGLVIFAGNPGQQKAKVSELSKFGRPAKLRSSSWWTRYFIQTGLTENEGPLKKFKKAAAKNKYKPGCQIFHLSS